MVSTSTQWRRDAWRSILTTKAMETININLIPITGFYSFTFACKQGESYWGSLIFYVVGKLVILTSSYDNHGCMTLYVIASMLNYCLTISVKMIFDVVGIFASLTSSYVSKRGYAATLTLNYWLTISVKNVLLNLGESCTLFLKQTAYRKRIIWVTDELSSQRDSVAL